MNKLLTTVFATLCLGAAAFTAQAHGFKLGEITIGHPYARSTAPGQPNGGAFLSLENRGADDKLVSADAGPIASRTELHTMSMDGDVMRMRRVDDIAVGSGKAVALKPGGYHVMMFGLKAPLKEGDTFPLKLHFEKAGDVTVTVNVEGPAADHTKMPMGEMKSDGKPDMKSDMKPDMKH